MIQGMMKNFSGLAVGLHLQVGLGRATGHEIANALSTALPQVDKPQTLSNQNGNVVNGHRESLIHRFWSQNGLWLLEGGKTLNQKSPQDVNAPTLAFQTAFLMADILGMGARWYYELPLEGYHPDVINTILMLAEAESAEHKAHVSELLNQYYAQQEARSGIASDVLGNVIYLNSHSPDAEQERQAA